MEKLALTVDEAAEALGVCKRVMYELVHRPDFPAFKPGGGKYIIPREGLITWMERAAKGEISV